VLRSGKGSSRVLGPVLNLGVGLLLQVRDEKGEGAKFWIQRLILGDRVLLQVSDEEGEGV
jgi:hypothetical protein